MKNNDGKNNLWNYFLLLGKKLDGGIGMLRNGRRRFLHGIASLWRFIGSNSIRNLILLVLLLAVATIGQKLLDQIGRIAQAQEIMGYGTMRHLHAAGMLPPPPQQGPTNGTAELPRVFSDFTQSATQTAPRR